MYTIVTGAGGFIGFHLCRRLILEGVKVIGIDNFNSYYDQTLKRDREKFLLELAKSQKVDFKIFDANIENEILIKDIFQKYKPNKVVNLAAQAGVRYSITNPDAYIKSNLLGFAVILECCRAHKIDHLVYAAAVRFMAGILKCLSQKIKVLIIQLVSMQPQRKAMNLWLIVIVTFMIFPQLD